MTIVYDTPTRREAPVKNQIKVNGTRAEVKVNGTRADVKAKRPQLNGIHTEVKTAPPEVNEDKSYPPSLKAERDKTEVEEKPEVNGVQEDPQSLESDPEGTHRKQNGEVKNKRPQQSAASGLGDDEEDA